MVQPESTPKPYGKGCLLAGVLLAIVLVAGVTRFVDAVRDAHHAALESQCRQDLFYLVHTLGLYSDVHGTLPPAYVADASGRPLYSWRVLVTPYLNHSGFLSVFDDKSAWDTPHNLAAACNVHLLEWDCEADGVEQARKPNLPQITDYVAITGPATAFPGAESVSFDDITDGLENTVLLVEMTSSDIHWTEPRDLHIEHMSFTVNDEGQPGLSSPHADGPGVLFADRRHYRVSGSIPPEKLRALFTIAGNEPVSRDELVKAGHLRR